MIVLFILIIIDSNLIMHKNYILFSKTLLNNFKFILAYFTIILSNVCYTYSQSDSLRQNPIDILRNDISAIISNPDFAIANIGVCIQSVETGEFIFKNNDSKNFVPASTQKVITTAAALDLLGEDFKFTTKLYLDGQILPGGEFLGNIIIRGLGDPTISKYYHKNPMDILENWTKKIDSMGINSIKGKIIADDSYFDDMYYGPGWSWDDFPYYYSSQVSALTINDNRVDFYIYSGDSVDDYSHITAYPVSSYYRLINNVKTVVSSNQGSVNSNREINSNVIKLNGSIPYEKSRKTSEVVNVTIDNPSMFFANLFKQKLEEKKIVVNGVLVRKADTPENIDYSAMYPVIETYSPPLSEIINVVNQESHNLAAEMIFKTLGKESSGNGSFVSGADYIAKFLAKAGVNNQNVRIVDGSGLSRLNLISPRSMVSVLSYIHRSSFREVFVKSLAKPGEPGTLKRRMGKSKAEKSVTAKTGSMNYISAICGYVNTSDNETFAFAIMLQNFTVPGTLANNLQDLLLMRLSSFSRK